MKKIVFCFSINDVKNLIDSSPHQLDFDMSLEIAINTISKSTYRLKNLDFEIELCTDVSTSRYFKNLPIDNISLDLEFLSLGEIGVVERKMLCISRQTVPFLYLDWDIDISNELFKEIYDCNQEDILVAAKYEITAAPNRIKTNKITYEELKTFSWLMDLKGEYVGEFVNNNKLAYDTKIVGFNNLGVRDIYIKNYLKCLNVANSSEQLSNPTLIIQDYLMHVTLHAQGGSCKLLFKDASNLTLFKKRLNKEDLPKIAKSHPDLRIEDSAVISDIDQFFKSLTLGKNVGVAISLCTVVMNRFNHIVRTLKHNIELLYKFKGIININLLDYNSEDGLEDFLYNQDWFKTAISDGILFYYKNYDQEFYHRTLPKNYIHSLSTGLYLINVDADNYVSESYLTYCLSKIRKENNFFLRPSLLSSPGSFGRIMIKAMDFKKIGGYNLKIKKYGFEDTEITLRLRKLGLNQCLAPYHLCNDSIEHSNSLRFLNEKPTTQIEDVSSSDHLNRRFKTKLNPNKENKTRIILFRLDEKRIKTKINVPHSYFLD